MLDERAYELLEKGTRVLFRILDEEVQEAPGDDAEFGMRIRLTFTGEPDESSRSRKPNPDGAGRSRSCDASRRCRGGPAVHPARGDTTEGAPVERPFREVQDH